MPPRAKALAMIAIGAGLGAAGATPGPWWARLLVGLGLALTTFANPAAALGRELGQAAGEAGAAAAAAAGPRGGARR